MSSFYRVYRTVTRCCVIFNHQRKSGVVLNWKWSQPVLPGGSIRLVSRDVNGFNHLDHQKTSPVFGKALLSQELLSVSWNMKTKHVKSKGDSSTSSKKKKHKHKKKKSKKKSKTKSKLAMAASKTVLQEDNSSSDSDIHVVYEARKPLQQMKKVPSQVEEILLDDDSQPYFPVSLGDIPLPQENCDSVDLAMIPLPEEEHLPNHVQIESYINIEAEVAVSQFREEVRVDVASSCTKTIYTYENEVTRENARMRELRSWENTSLGNALERSGGDEGTAFSVMSYNVLAQRLLEDHKFLYTCHDVRCLQWDHRKKTLLNEFRTANADVLCLQEVQFDHLEWFNDQLSGLGYMGLFKRRTHDHVDGCAIYFKKDRFRLLESSSVEYYQPGVQILDRDNVALIARLEVVGSDQQLVIATTHLLFNPKRHDIKLAQMQLLLAELERIAYMRFDHSAQRSLYRPIIITGDFNLQPNSAVYRFITDGFIDYSVLSARTLQPPKYSTYYQQSLLPRDLQVSNTCQHLRVLQNRQSRREETLEGLLNELRLLQPYNSDNLEFIKQYSSALSSSSLDPGGRRDQNSWASKYNQGPDSQPTTSCTNGGDADGMEPGMLSHSFHLKSVYRHFKRDPSSEKPLKEATTHQSAWVTVDYIFYSGMWNQVHQATVEGPLKLLSRFGLPTEKQCNDELKHIPNMACGSDHLPLLARFLLRS